ncbi:hypothetical protein NDU88_005063, partial [Pleurodeles waltl]
SIFENQYDPVSSLRISSIVGVRCLFLLIARLGMRMLTQMRTASGCLGFLATTIGDTHSVGPETLSMIPACSRIWSLRSTLGRRWNATRQCLRAVGVTESSIWSRSG